MKDDLEQQIHHVLLLLVILWYYLQLFSENCVVYCTEISWCWSGTRRIWFPVEFDNWFGWFIVNYYWWIFSSFVELHKINFVFYNSVALSWSLLIAYCSLHTAPSSSTHSKKATAHSAQPSAAVTLHSPKLAHLIWKWSEVRNSHQLSPPNLLEWPMLGI